MSFGDIWREPSHAYARYPTHRPGPVTIRQVIEAWSVSGEVSNGSWRGATAEELSDAESALGRKLPQEMKDLYTEYNGGDFVGGNIQLDPLFPAKYRDYHPPPSEEEAAWIVEHGFPDIETYLETETFAVTTASELFREYQFPVPPELVMFGGNGSENWYGVWLPETGEYRPVVIEIGEEFDRDALAIVGDDIAGFLAGHTAYYLLLYASDGYDLSQPLDILGVPDDLRGDPFDDDLYYGLLNWANPNLPEKRPGVYEGSRWTPEAINEFARIQ